MKSWWCSVPLVNRELVVARTAIPVLRLLGPRRRLAVWYQRERERERIWEGVENRPASRRSLLDRGGRRRPSRAGRRSGAVVVPGFEASHSHTSCSQGLQWLFSKKNSRHDWDDLILNRKIKFDILDFFFAFVSIYDSTPKEKNENFWRTVLFAEKKPT